MKMRHLVNVGKTKPIQTQFKPNTKPNKANFKGKKMLLRLTTNGQRLLWIPAAAGMAAISRGKDEERILIDCWCGIVDN